jgi:RNA-directed DNA polymerase
MDRVRVRVGDKRVLALVKAFLKSGLLAQDGARRHTDSGTPQGGILSPLLANIALSTLDEFITQYPGGPATDRRTREKRRRRGEANYRIIRYADDFLVLVAGTRSDAEGIKLEVARALSPMGLRLSEEKTRITHIDEGFDFLGWRIQRHYKKGAERQYVYTYPSRKALSSVMGKVKHICQRMDLSEPFDALLRQLNPALLGWCMYFRPGVSSATFGYLSDYVWRRVLRWLYRKHKRFGWQKYRHRYCAGGTWPSSDKRELFDPGKVRTTRYVYRGGKIPDPWVVAA